MILTLSLGVSKICLSTSSKESFVKEPNQKETKVVSIKKIEKVEEKEVEPSLEVPVTEEVSKDEVMGKEEKEIQVEKEIKEVVNTPSPILTETPTVQETPSVLETPVLPDVIETIRRNESSLGTLGRLFLPSVDFNVAVYSTDLSDGNNAQKIVDQKDSAAYFQIRNHSVIADHNHQGFHRIIDLEIGDKAYIKTSDGQIQVYRMTQKFEGMNLGSDLTDLNGKSAFDLESDLILYTCYKIYEYENHVMITMWELEH